VSESTHSSADSVCPRQGKPVSEDIYTLPNLLTTARLISVPFLGYFVLQGQMYTATVLLFVSGFTDLLDGWLARKYDSYTVFGSIADPAADKALMTVMVITLAMKGLLPGETDVEVAVPQQAADRVFLSAARNCHLGPRCRPRACRFLDPLRKFTAAKDICTILGLFTALCLGTTDANQQVQHFLTAAPRRCEHGATVPIGRHASKPRTIHDGIPVVGRYHDRMEWAQLRFRKRRSHVFES